MPRPFLAIMREAYRARRAGLSAPVALLSQLSDEEWEIIWARLMRAAELEAKIGGMKKRA